jgi:hypothetical protein
MKKSSQIIALAELDGWVWRASGNGTYCWFKGAHCAYAPLFYTPRVKEQCWGDLPDYLGDMPALRGLENKVFGDSRWEAFASVLADVSMGRLTVDQRETLVALVKADLYDRAEAILRMHQKWINDEEPCPQEQKK